MIIEGESRVRMLIPAAFLEAVKDPEELDDFKYMVKFPSAAYAYLPTIEHSYAFLSGQIITPICDDGAETFYLYLIKDSKRRFISCTLEYSEILEDFGSNFNHLLAHLLIQLYEFSEQSVSELTNIGLRFGFKNAGLLFSKLEQATLDGTRSTFEREKQWREKHLATIICAE
ncbi:MAG: hypothetical protein ACRCYY_16840 [Trueperaceae bacterium]